MNVFICLQAVQKYIIVWVYFYKKRSKIIIFTNLIDNFEVGHKKNNYCLLINLISTAYRNNNYITKKIY